MFIRKLGKSNLEVSALGLGCWAIGGPWTVNGTHPAGWGEVHDADSIRAIQYAVDQGITFFDTAANYGAGHSERILGQALKNRRSQVVIATKFGYRVDEDARDVTHYGDPREGEVASNIRQDCEASLRRLDTDVIDLYQFHVDYYLPERVGPILAILEELVDEGKIRFYGWSTDSLQSARAFMTGEHCVAIQHNLTVVKDAPQLIQLCEENDLASINRSPLGRGLLTGKYTRESDFPKNDIRSRSDFTERWAEPIFSKLAAVRAILTRHGRTLAQGALCWIWGRSAVTLPIPGFRNTAQLEENIAALEHGPLSQEDMQAIEEVLGRPDHRPEQTENG
jgi:aryl-alcohol dehydrogenase-like predicted oxidoreductase